MSQRNCFPEFHLIFLLIKLWMQSENCGDIHEDVFTKVELKIKDFYNFIEFYRSENSN